MLVCRNAEGVHGKKKVGNPWAKATAEKANKQEQIRTQASTNRKFENMSIPIIASSAILKESAPNVA